MLHYFFYTDQEFYVLSTYFFLNLSEMYFVLLCVVNVSFGFCTKFALYQCNVLCVYI